MPARMRRTHSVIFALLLAGSLASDANAEDKTATNAAVASPAVHIDNFAFSPQEITVAPGATVTWVNRDDIPHNVVASNKAFRSKVMDTDQQYSFTFSTPGTYEYFCALHPHMKGTVIVK
jgi:amicyanin